MFSPGLKDWICDSVRPEYTGDVRRDTEAFEKALALATPEAALEGVHDLLPEVLEEMSEASSIGALQGMMERFMKVEPFLKHLFGALYPDRYAKTPRQEPDGLDFAEWTLAPLLKQAFAVVPREYNLTKKSPAGLAFPYRAAYDLVYEKRNDSAHNYSKMRQREVFELITACLTVYLDVSGRCCLQIGEAFHKETVSSGFSALQYCQSIVRSHKNEVKQGFTYIDIKWKATGSTASAYSTVQTIADDTANHLVKILGEAGCGKTTIMRQLVYLQAQKYVKKQTGAIPVYISLANVENDPSLRADIQTVICSQLGIERELLENMLLLNAVRLYLDGFNEILDTKTKKQIAWSIDELSRQFPELFIYLTDRSLVRSAIEVMNSALTYRLYPLDNHLKESFITNNCRDAAAKQLLLDYFAGDPHLYENFSTPIKLIQLIEYVAAQKQLPEDFDREYIRFVFDRELLEKKDENASYLEDFACALAIESDTGMPLRLACACLAKCKNLLGYTTPDSLKCLNLLIEMGILTNEEGIVDFKFQSYRNYFWMNAFDNHLADLLGDGA